MVYVETIPGIRHLPNPGSVGRVPAKRSSFNVRVERVQEADLQAFRQAMIAGMESVKAHGFATSEQIEKRTEDYYKKLWQNVIQYTLLAAKDPSTGNIIGCLEAEQFEVEGQKIGFGNYICVDQNQRRKSIGLELMRAYEDILLSPENENIIFLMANVHHTNMPSLRLCREAGLKYIYLHKTPEGRSHWYAKPLRHLPEGTPLPITETDYLPAVAGTVAKALQKAMEEHGLGQIKVTDHQIRRGEESLYSIESPNDQTRRRFQEIIFRAVDKHLLDSQPGKTCTPEDTEEEIGKVAKEVKNAEWQT